MKRLRAGGRVFLCVMLTLPIVMFIHEVITFGVMHGFLTQKPAVFLDGGPITVQLMVFMQIFMGVCVAFVLSVLSVVFYGSRFQLWVLAVCYLLGYFWAGNGTASGYRGNFGATWQFPEPFMELLFHPVLTPALAVIGLSAFLWMSRQVWQAKP